MTRIDRLVKLLDDPQVDTILANLFDRAVERDPDLDTEDPFEKMGVVIAEGLRLAYTLSKEIGVERTALLNNFNTIMSIEDSKYKKSAMN